MLAPLILASLLAAATPATDTTRHATPAPDTTRHAGSPSANRPTIRSACAHGSG